MDDLNFFQKDIEKIQKELLKKIEKVLKGLVVLNDEQLAQAFKQINLVDELNALGFPALLEKVKNTYDSQAIKSFAVLSASQKAKQTTTAISAIEFLSTLDLTNISAGVTQYANEIKTLMFRGVLTGESSASIMQGLQANYGVGKALSSSQRVALLNDSFARYARTTTAKLFENIPEQRFVYVGPNDTKTRQECADTLLAQGDGLTAKEIEALTTGVTFADGGGFNCRHEWVPV